MKICLSITLLIIIFACEHRKPKVIGLNDRRLLQLIDDFSDNDWTKVYTAKDTLEMFEAKSLPYLFDLLSRDNTYIKLTNTEDLIYPGTTEFYGHGWNIDYDIDWMTIRAGWAIEEITFQNFGFKENWITDDSLWEIAKDSIKYQQYTATRKYPFKVDSSKVEKVEEIKAKAINWWTENRDSWTRIKGITEAIESNDTIRQMNALYYLRSGGRIKGLNRKVYRDIVEQRVAQLRLSQSMSVQFEADMVCEGINYEVEQ
jgi:hypothetical protein